MEEMNIAIYLRLSEEDDDKQGSVDSNSIISQRALLQNYVASQFTGSAVNVMEFCDDGYTGTNFKRPSFETMISHAKDGRIQVIVVKDFSRFGRDYLEVGRYLEYIFPVLQIRFISVNDGYDSQERFGTTGGMSVAVTNLVNNMYSSDLSKKVRSARATRISKGEYVESIVPYGYKKDPKDKHHIIVDPEVSWIVQRIFAMAADGDGYSKIARWLNQEGILTRTEYRKSKGLGISYRWDYITKQIWNNVAVKNILQNEFYTGKLISNKSKKGMHVQHKNVTVPRDEWIIMEDHHEALVSEEIFQKANSFHRKREKKPRPYRMNHLIVCGYCGRRLMKNHNKYVCRIGDFQEDSGCKKIRIVEKEVKDAVLEQVNQMAALYLDKSQKVNAHWSVEDTEATIRKYQAEINRCKTSKMDYYEWYKSGRISKDEYLRKIEADKQSVLDAEESIKQLEQQLEELRTKSNAKIAITSCTLLLHTTPVV